MSKKKKPAAAQEHTPDIPAPDVLPEEDNIPVQSFSEMMAFAADEDDIPAETKKAENKPAALQDNPQPPPKAEGKNVPTAEETLTSGPMISKEEAERRSRAEDALDRDLAAARRKKLQEEAYNKHQRDLEMQKEAERLARAEQAKQRSDSVQETAKKRAELKAAQAAIADM